jgi:hypothetical protein
MTATKAIACDEEPKAGSAAFPELVGDGVELLVAPLGLLVVMVPERRLLVPVFTGELLEEVVETGEVVPVLEPIAEVGAVIKLCSVSLKVPVMPVRVNLAEKLWNGNWPCINPIEVKRMK